MMMSKVNKGTKKAQEMIWDLMHNTNRRTIWDAYSKPSYAKVRSFEEIQGRAYNTEGYNHDLHITGANSSFYSTAYSFTTAEGQTFIVKDTASNTYITEM